MLLNGILKLSLNLDIARNLLLGCSLNIGVVLWVGLSSMLS